MATIKDIAQATGLSIATISKYLNGGSVRAANKEAIERAIGELNYSVNAHARSLKTNRSMTIGAIIPELDNQFITTILSYAAQALKEHGYGLLVCSCQSDENQERDSVRFLMGKSVDGIINMPITPDGSHLKMAVEKRLPIVLIDRNINALRASAGCVLVDNAGVSARATQALIDKGHTRIGIIIGPPEIITSQQRLLGYNQAHVQSGLFPDPALVVYGNYTVKGGHDAAKLLLSRGVTALFATNYEMTLGSIIAINEAGIRIPGDISFIGFDNLHIADVVTPRLTIVTQPLCDIGAHAAKMMLTQLACEGERKFQAEILPADISWGDSIAPPLAVQ